MLNTVAENALYVSQILNDHSDLVVNGALFCVMGVICLVMFIGAFTLRSVE